MFSNYSIFSSLNTHQNRLDVLSKQMSTGKRINSAADDVGGIGIVNRFKTQVNGFEAGSKNITQLNSAMESIDGAIASAEDILLELKDKALQAQNDTLSAADRTNLQQEMDDLKAAFDDVVSNFNFNGKNYLDNGTATTANTGMGTFTFSAKDISDGGTEGVDLAAMDVSTSAGASAAQVKIEASLDVLSDTRGYYGGKMNTLSFRQDAIDVQRVNIDSARSRIEDVDMSKAMSEFTKLQILEQANLELLQQRDSMNYNILALFQ